jgi:hypothetical protein
MLVEMIELRDHPWFVATQAHPEFKSRPEAPAPLFLGFVTSAIQYTREMKLPLIEKRRHRAAPTGTPAATKG